MAEACRQIGVTEQTLYRWRREYGGMKVDQARRMKELEAENTRLKKLVADLSLDTLGRAMLADHRTRAPLGHPENPAHPLNANTATGGTPDDGIPQADSAPMHVHRQAVTG
jgi:hypothetical protein